MNTWLTWVAALSPIFTALFGVGGVVAYLEYRSRIPGFKADTAKTVTGTEVSVAQAWQNYAQQIDARFQKMQVQYDELYNSFDLMRKSLQARDDEIAMLKRRIADLETELMKYQTVVPTVEKARETLHQTVDKEINQIKNSNGKQ